MVVEVGRMAMGVVMVMPLLLVLLSQLVPLSLVFVVVVAAAAAVVVAMLDVVNHSTSPRASDTKPSHFVS